MNSDAMLCGQGNQEMATASIIRLGTRADGELIRPRGWGIAARVGAGRGQVGWRVVATALLLTGTGFAAGLAPVSAAQEPEHLPGLNVPAPWRRVLYTTDQGLPSNSVDDLIETADGIVWVSTDRGPAWFDGYSWHAVGQDDPGLSRSARSLTALSDGRIILSGHLRAYKGDTAGLEPMELPGSGVAVYHRAVESSKGILFLVERGSDRFLVEAGHFQPYQLGGVPEAPITVAQGSGGGPIWVTTNRGVYRVSGSDAERVLSDDRPGWQVYPERDGRALAHLVGTDAPRQLLELGDGEPKPTGPTAGDEISGAALGPSGEAVVAYDGGYFAWRGGPDDPWGVDEFAGVDFGRVTFARFREDGDLWVGTQSGLWLVRLSSRRWNRVEFPFPDPRNQVYALALNGEQAWAGTADGVMRWRAGQPVQWTQGIDGVPLGRVDGLASDPAGHVWLTSSTGARGAFRWDGNRWRHFGAAEGLPDDNLSGVAIGGTGALWAIGGGAHAAQLYRFDGERFQRVELDADPSPRAIYAFAEAPDGTRWFGTDIGLLRWRDSQWRQWERWRDGPPSFGLAFNVAIHPSAITVGPDGAPWFAEMRWGLGMVDERDSIVMTTTRHGLASDSVTDVAADSDGTLWVATRRGLCTRSPSRIWACLDRTLGLRGANLSAVATSGRRVFVGSRARGFEILNRGLPPSPPRVRFGAPAVVGRTAELRWQAEAYLGNIPPEAIETRFRLDDGDWSSWSREHRTRLESLPWGSHHLAVQTKGILGSVGEAVEQAFRVPVPAYRRLSVLLPVALLTLASGILVLIIARHRQEAAVALQASERRFRVLTNASREGIALCETGRITTVNPRLAEMFGCPPESMIGKAFASYLDVPADAGIDLSSVASTTRGIEAEGRSESGRRFPVEIHGHPMPTEQGNMQVWTVADITQRVAAEKARRASAARFSAAFRLGPAGAVIFQRSTGEIMDVNESFTRMSGIARAEALGRTATELGLVSPDDRGRIHRILDQSSVIEGEPMSLITRKGQRHVLVWSGRLRLEEVECVLTIFTDVTDQQKAAAEISQHRETLQTLTKRLMEAQEVERRSIARELHDHLGGTLAAIKLNLQAIAVTGGEAIREQVADGISLVGSALEGARNLALQLRPSILDDLGLEPAVRWYAEQTAKRSDINIEVAVDEGGGQPRLDREVETACFRIVQEALTNILRHADAHTVSVSVCRGASHVEVKVVDDGKGFDASRLEEVAKGRLGLVGMRERAQAVGGDVEITSRPGAGTSVYARVPLLQDLPA